MTSSAIICALLTISVMTFLILFIKFRTITYATGGTLLETDASFSDKITYMSGMQTSELSHLAGNSEQEILLPITELITEDKFALMSQALEQEIIVYIDGLQEKFYDEQMISIDRDAVFSCDYCYQNGITKLVFNLNTVYECKITKENNSLCLRLYRPTELYDTVVIIDAGHGALDTGDTVDGISEKKIILNVIKQLQTLSTDQSVGIYYTRLTDEAYTDEQRENYIEAVSPDMLISVHTAFLEQDSDMYGINVYYNSRFYINGLTGAVLADMLANHVADLTCNRANGLFDADENHPLIQNAIIPAVEIEIGYISNTSESTLLQETEYQKRIATGIYQAILQAKDYERIFADQNLKF